MSRIERDSIIEMAIVVLLLAAALAGYFYIDAASCKAKAEGMGFEYKWSIIASCQIEVEDGRWIPLDSYYFKEE